MTTEIQNPPDELQNPSGSDTRLALDEFSEAMADGEVPTSVPDETGAATTIPASLDALYDIPVNITVVLGRTSIEVTDLLALTKGDVVELDRKVGEAIDIFINNRLIARGEIVLVDDRIGITMTEIIKSNQVS